MINFIAQAQGSDAESSCPVGDAAADELAAAADPGVELHRIACERAALNERCLWRRRDVLTKVQRVYISPLGHFLRERCGRAGVKKVSLWKQEASGGGYRGQLPFVKEQITDLKLYQGHT